MPKELVVTKDSVLADENSVTFFHRNPEKTIFDVTVAQQGLESVIRQDYCLH